MWQWGGADFSQVATPNEMYTGLGLATHLPTGASLCIRPTSKVLAIK
eukprot:COSAG04_NODE_27075_length_287_cov_0.654255_1_plen_46_part_01